MNAHKKHARAARQFALTFVVLSLLAAISLLVLGSDTSQIGALGHRTLVARAVSEFEQETEQCRDVHQAHDQCAFVKHHCADEHAGLFDYLELYYCRLPKAKPVGFFIIAAWASFLFTTIGVAASEFFCINLDTISKLLGMSESLAGVTFLAFGNGSPDVFSTFAAVKADSGSLALGELIGAAGFITAVVTGSMALIKPFKVPWKAFMREACFFTVAIAFSMIFLSNGSLALWESAVMVGYYVFYVVVVVSSHWWKVRRRNRRRLNSLVRGHYHGSAHDDLAQEEPYRDEEDDETLPTTPRNVTREDFNNLEAANYGNSVPEPLDDFDEEEIRKRVLGELSSSMRVARTPTLERRTTFNPIRPSLLGALEFRAFMKSLERSRNLNTTPINMRRYSDTADHGTFDHDAFSAISDPEVRSTLEHPHSAGDDRLPRPFRGNRSRAVSENNVSVPSRGRRDRTGLLAPGIEHFSTSPTQIPYSDNPAHDHPFEAGHTDHSVNATSPLVSVSSPPKEDGELDEEQYPRPPHPSRSDTGVHLAPPASGATTPISRPTTPRQGQSNVSAGARLASPHRPALRLSVPSSRRSTPSQSPAPSSIGRYRDHSPSTASATPSVHVIPPDAPAELDRSEEAQEPTLTDKPPRWWPLNILPPPELLIKTLLPSLYGWREKSIWPKILGLASAPSFFILAITLPVVETEAQLRDLKQSAIPSGVATPAEPWPLGPENQNAKNNSVVIAEGRGGSIAADNTAETQSTAVNVLDEDVADPLLSPSGPVEHTSEPTSNPRFWNRWLVLVHCFTSPLFMVIILSTSAEKELREQGFLVLYTVIGSLIASAFILFTTTPNRPPPWHIALTFVGFAVSITWISTIAEEVVSVLKSFGVIFNMSDSILGLTIFAVGNSLGDFVANFTVANLGYQVMAFSACFGGPMLNILLGIGLSGLYMVIHGAEARHHKHPGKEMKFKPYHVHLSSTLLISAIALLVTLVGLMVALYFNKYVMDKKIGIGLISLWVAATVGNVAVELSGLALLNDG